MTYKYENREEQIGGAETEPRAPADLDPLSTPKMHESCSIYGVVGGATYVELP